jgi:hypothetical protein
MPLDDGRMIETCCDNNIRGEEELLRWRTIICVIYVILLAAVGAEDHSETNTNEYQNQKIAGE